MIVSHTTPRSTIHIYAANSFIARDFSRWPSLIGGGRCSYSYPLVRLTLGIPSDAAQFITSHAITLTKVISHPLNPLVALTRDNKQTFLARPEIFSPPGAPRLALLHILFAKPPSRRLSRGSGSLALQVRIINY